MVRSNLVVELRRETEKVARRSLGGGEPMSAEDEALWERVRQIVAPDFRGRVNQKKRLSPADLDRLVELRAALRRRGYTFAEDSE